MFALHDSSGRRQILAGVSTAAVAPGAQSQMAPCNWVLHPNVQSRFDPSGRAATVCLGPTRGIQDNDKLKTEKRASNRFPNIRS